MKKLIIDLLLITFFFAMVMFCLEYVFGLSIDKCIREILAFIWGIFLFFKIFVSFMDSIKL
jgi:hypothetical protein